MNFGGEFRGVLLAVAMQDCGDISPESQMLPSRPISSLIIIPSPEINPAPLDVGDDTIELKADSNGSFGSSKLVGK